MKDGKAGQVRPPPGSADETRATWDSPIWVACETKSWGYLLLPAAAFVLLGVAGLTIDVPLSRAAIEISRPGAVRELPALQSHERSAKFFQKLVDSAREALEMSETFGHGVGVAMLVLAVYVLDRRRRWAIPRLLLLTYGAGLAANLAKMVIARTRPSGFDLNAGDVWQTFEAWFRFGAGGSLHQSFPSAHTTTAVVFAVLLSCLYPHARRLFVALAVLVAAQRLQCGAHYLSDICSGAAIGWLFVVGSFRAAPFTRWMNRLEARWAGQQRQAVVVSRRAA
ncbi:MAG TPA: phosphatase PAP2 family protein [Pirellulales bacterium]|jgi:membrane-associated phospholipid phosphatase|nr:phosphatase PAP2 family protein [Pirellulales bacterium]